MSELTIEEIAEYKRIVEGANDFSGLAPNAYGTNYGGEYLKISEDVHNLSDLRTIIAQQEEIASKDAEIERLRDFIKRYRYRIKGGEPMQKYIEEEVLKENPMSEHKRSKLNAFLDNCPEWVQQAVWGDGGMRDEIEQLQQRVAKLDARCNGFQRQRDINLDDAMRYKQERDALAAHVERVNKSLLWFIEIIETDFMPDLEDYAELQEEISDAKNLVSQSPQTSLAEIGIGIEMAAEEHAHKIRNRGDGD